jgi:hypothetical protein
MWDRPFTNGSLLHRTLLAKTGRPTFLLASKSQPKHTSTAKGLDLISLSVWLKATGNKELPPFLVSVRSADACRWETTGCVNQVQHAPTLFQEFTRLRHSSQHCRPSAKSDPRLFPLTSHLRHRIPGFRPTVALHAPESTGGFVCVALRFRAFRITVGLRGGVSTVVLDVAIMRGR